MSNSHHYGTRAIHVGSEPDPTTGIVSSAHFLSLAHAENTSLHFSLLFITSYVRTFVLFDTPQTLSSLTKSSIQYKQAPLYQPSHSPRRTLKKHWVKNMALRVPTVLGRALSTPDLEILLEVHLREL